MKAPSSEEAEVKHDGSRDVRQRPAELEDWLNRRVFHPLSHRLALALGRTPVSPNMVSAAGGVAVALAAVSYGFASYPLSVLAGFLLHLSWHVLDGADGDLARLTGRVSPFGEFIDGLFDYLGHIVVYLVLAILIAPQLGIWTLVLVAMAAFGRAAQQNFFETIRRSYEFWVYGRAWLGTTTTDRSSTGNDTIAQRLVRGYLDGAGSMLPEVAQLNRMFAQSADRQDALREAVSHHREPLLAGLAPFGSNLRTLALGLAMLVQMPLLYLLYEAIVLNLALAVAIRRKRALLQSVIRQIEGNQPSSTDR
jgi:phosphatidylglycerophosphate synthase